MTKREHRAALVLGRRYTGVEAHTAGIVDVVCPPEQLREVALTAAGRLAGTEGLDRRTLTALKHDLYKDPFQTHQNSIPGYSHIFSITHASANSTRMRAAIGRVAREGGAPINWRSASKASIIPRSRAVAAL